jgi:CubicO group peptidase (beta-lactamase class C family)
MRLLIAPAILLFIAASASAQQVTPIRPGVALRANLAAGDTARYSIVLRDSTHVLGTVAQSDQPLVVRILAPGRRQRARSENPATGDLRFAAILGDTGTHQIEVLAPSGKATSFALTLLKQEPVAREAARRADQLLARYDAMSVPGGEVRVWRNGRVLYTKAFGAANLTHNIPYRSDTPTNIGSTSKQFTAFAVLLQAERGALSLDDDIRKHVPELPDFGDTIRVRHLITHTTGLREFINLLDMSERRVADDWIDRREVIEVVQRQPKLQNVPGAEFNYNNTAFGLAAIIVERTSGKTFPDFVRDNVFLPLGMTRSTVRADRATIIPGASTGYISRPGGFAEATDLGGAVGAGAIYTTVEDLQRWAENMLAPNPRVGTRAMLDLMMTNAKLNDGKLSGYGMGLFTDEQSGLRRVHHGGADISQRSMLVLYPSLNAGVSVQSNNSTFSYNVAFDIAAAFFGDAMTAATTTASASATYDVSRMTAERFDALAATYALDAQPAFQLRVFREGTTFYVQATGQPRVAMVPNSDSSFALTGVPAGLRFHRDASGRATAMTLLQGGEQRASRVSDAAASAVPARKLSSYVGRYWSDELSSAIAIELRADTLLLQQRRREDAPLRAATSADTFEGRNLTLTFERDRNGEVIGLYVSNGRTRDVRFTRALP